MQYNKAKVVIINYLFYVNNNGKGKYKLFSTLNFPNNLLIKETSLAKLSINN